MIIINKKGHVASPDYKGVTMVVTGKTTVRQLVYFLGVELALANFTEIAKARKEMESLTSLMTTTTH
jgi:hypothetical protein|tara:strand:- start:8107 stop:8307 length:201 start_codon:yes stop_codon:yes gene_type:complete